MTRYAIWRELDHTLSETEKEAITIRAIGALEWFPHVAWVRSFAIDEPGVRLHSLCIYEARTVQELRDTSLRCAVPFVEIRPVEETVGPAVSTEGDMVLVSGRAGAFAPPAAWAGICSYLDGERGYAWGVYLAPAGAALPAPAPGIDSIERVVENHPAMWAWVYESLNIPKHWELEGAGV